MRFKSRLPRSGKALSVLFGGLALVAGAPSALAQSDARPAAGLLNLPNVRIETATASQIAQIAPRASDSFRAYKDPVTGELRDQTPEEAMERGVAKSAKRMSAKSAVVSPHGGISIALDQAHMVDSVVTKDDAGNLRMQCVTGDNAAAKALVQGAEGKGHRHDR